MAPLKSMIHLRDGEAALFGYGSLLCQSSMERTYGRRYARTPVIAELVGWRRVWDVLVANQTFYFTNEEGKRCYPTSIAYLNVRRSHSTAINGLLYVVRPEDLAAFDRREEVYDRVDVSAALAGATVTGGPVYIYVGKPECVQRGPEPKERVAIRATYLEIIENGLSSLGPEFRAGYEQSTDQPPEENIIADLRDGSPSL